MDRWNIPFRKGWIIMVLGIGEKWPIMVEITEERQGGAYQVVYTQGRRVFLKPANISTYQVKGVQKDIIAPEYRHLVPIVGGKVLLRLYSPNPDEFFVMAVDDDEIKVREPIYKEIENKIKIGPVEVKTVKNKIITGYKEVVKKGKVLRPVVDEESKAWTDWQIEKSHEDWTKKGFLDKYAIFLMLIVCGIIMTAGMKFQADGQIKVAQATQALGELVANSQATQVKYIDAEFKLMERIDKMLDKYGIPKASANTTITQTEPPPPPV
jgi:polyhydroxyalkanoate synthesis regulator phasin